MPTTEPDLLITVSRKDGGRKLDREVAERVRIALAKRPGVKQIHIARAIGMPQQSFNNRMKGSVAFEASVLAQVALYLECDLSELLPSREELLPIGLTVTRQYPHPHTAPVVSIWKHSARPMVAASFTPSAQAS